MRRANRVAARLVTVGVTLGLAACGVDEGPSFEPRDLEPYPNRFAGADGEPHRAWEAQPRRENPRALAIAEDGGTVWIALQGSPDAPGTEVLAFDTNTRGVVERYAVGHGPSDLALHPDGRTLAVANRYSNYLSVIDTSNGRVTNVEADPYVEGLAFSPDGERLYLANRWRDALQVWDVETSRGRLHVHDNNLTQFAHGIPVGTNPQEVVVSDDGTRIYVASIAGLTISVIDADTLREIDIDADPATTDHGAPEGVTRLDVLAPPNQLSLHDGLLYVPTTSGSSHHPALSGPDTNHDGIPGDGTPNTGFADLQNEIAVYAVSDLSPFIRYTSDTICCPTFLDVSPDDPEGELLPNESLWIVGGALPDRSIVVERDGGAELLVVYSGSNELQRFAIDGDGELVPGAIIPTGFNPRDIVVSPDGRFAYVSNRLGESLTIVDLDSFEVVDTVVVGDVSGGPFPATDAEIGEFYYFAGAAFSMDGDQTCNHCHRDRGNIAKSFFMPLLADARGTRANPASRGMFETRPWFVEGAMDENNFFPVINEFTRPENFCCWDYRDDPTCATTPPEECISRPFPYSLPTRDGYFLARANETLGRERSFGGAIDTRIDYMGTTRLLSLFIMHEPALLPNPNPQTGPNVERGAALFRSPATGCINCHPEPGFAVSFGYNPFDALLHFGPLVTPARAENGDNLDLATGGFLNTFPMARQDPSDIRLTAPTLVGIWDHAAMFLHDGRARSLRECLATPGHASLRPGETGFNETDGIPDTHGGTSQLTPGELADMITFIESL